MRWQGIQANLAFMESVHRRIKRLREAQKLSLEAFAKLVGVKWQSAQQWEREKGGTAPSRKHQARAAEALRVTVSELMQGAATALAVNEEVPEYGDPRARKLGALFYWLTSEQQKELMDDVESKAATNRMIAREINSKVRPVSDKRVAQAFKSCVGALME